MSEIEQADHGSAAIDAETPVVSLLAARAAPQLASKEGANLITSVSHCRQRRQRPSLTDSL